MISIRYTLDQWCKKCGLRAKIKYGPRRHELWPAKGPKMSIVMRPAKLRSAARGGPWRPAALEVRFLVTCAMK